jgi:hypothetical protein
MEQPEGPGRKNTGQGKNNVNSGSFIKKPIPE